MGKKKKKTNEKTQPQPQALNPSPTPSRPNKENHNQPVFSASLSEFIYNPLQKKNAVKEEEKFITKKKLKKNKQNPRNQLYRYNRFREIPQRKRNKKPGFQKTLSVIFIKDASK